MAMVLVAGALFRANAAGRDPEAPREARGGDAACGSRRRDVRTLVFHCRCVRRYSARRSRDRQVELVDLVLGQVRYGCVDPAVTAPRLRSLPRQSFSPTKCLFCVFTLNRHRHRRRRSRHRASGACVARRLARLRALAPRGARAALGVRARLPRVQVHAPVGRCRRVLDPLPVRVVVVSRLLFARRSARSEPVSSAHRDGRRPRGAGASAYVGQAVWRLSPPQPSRARSVCVV